MLVAPTPNAPTRNAPIPPNAPTAVGRPGTTRGQGGFALIEVLVAVTLMGTVLAGISLAMLTLIATTSATSDAQRMQTALQNYTESLKAGTYQPCGTTGSPPVVGPTAAQVQGAHDGDPAAFRPAAGSGITVEVVDVEFLSSASAALPPSSPPTTMVNGVGTFSHTCPPGGDAGRQRLTVRVSLPGRAPLTGDVVVAEAPIDPAP